MNQLCIYKEEVFGTNLTVEGVILFCPTVFGSDFKSVPIDFNILEPSGSLK